MVRIPVSVNIGFFRVSNKNIYNKNSPAEAELFEVRMIGVEPTRREALAPETSVSTISPHPLFRKVGQRYKMFLKNELYFFFYITTSKVCSLSHP